MRLTNASTSGLTLPLRSGPDGAVFPSRSRRDGTTTPLVPCIVAAGASLEVPAWYAAELRIEDGHRARLECGELVLTDESVEPTATAPAAVVNAAHVTAETTLPAKGKGRRRG